MTILFTKEALFKAYYFISLEYHIYNDFWSEKGTPAKGTSKL